MHRIAAAMLIVVAVLALNGGMLREAFAEDAMIRIPARTVEPVQPVVVKNAKLLSLLVILESLRQVPVSLDPQKV
jgi:hypothetical protein